MSHIVRNRPWGTVDLILHENRVFFQQNWFYHWLTEPGVNPWTYPERLHFHNSLDRQIWARWSNRIVLQVQGTTPLARRLARTGVPINFDVRWVRVNGHWDVFARKLPRGGSYRSNVLFGRRVINLDSEDLAPHIACRDDRTTCAENFLTVPHEFSHTLDNRDEYNRASPYYADTASIVNIGGKVRARHLHLIVTELNTMVRGCTFSVPAEV